MLTTARKWKYFTCRKCGVVNPDYLTFGGGSLDRPKYYCLHHVPLHSRVRLWWQERFPRHR